MPSSVRWPRAKSTAIAQYAMQSYITHILPTVADVTNLTFVRNVLGASRVSGGAIICRTPNAFPLVTHFRAAPVADL